MNLNNLLLSLSMIPVLLLPVFAQAADKAITDSQLGLEKSAVFDSPSPKNFSYEGGFPGSGKVLERSYPGAPPQIPHDISSFIPVTATNNMCMGCHNRGGAPAQKGQPTSIPPSHYTDLRGGGGKGSPGKEVVGARFVCTQCHVPQADVRPLVKNSFKK